MHRMNNGMKVPTFPKHCHDGREKNVIASHMPDDYREGVRFFCKKSEKK